eukprot:1162865-Prymnesium_polylepis.1
MSTMTRNLLSAKAERAPSMSPMLLSVTNRNSVRTKSSCAAASRKPPMFSPPKLALLHTTAAAL